jgi:hypothetical protein
MQILLLCNKNEKRFFLAIICIIKFFIYIMLFFQNVVTKSTFGANFISRIECLIDVEMFTALLKVIKKL